MSSFRNAALRAIPPDSSGRSAFKVLARRDLRVRLLSYRVSVVQLLAGFLLFMPFFWMSTAYAQDHSRWIFLTDHYKNKKMYLDPHDITRSSGVAGIWQLNNLQRPGLRNGVRYWSSLWHFQFNCQDERYRIDDIVFYSQQWGHGKMVDEIGGQVDFKPIVPGTIAEGMFQGLCHPE